MIDRTLIAALVALLLLPVLQRTGAAIERPLMQLAGVMGGPSIHTERAP